MHVLMRLLVLAAAALAAPSGFAAPPATVDAVRMPAWVERDGRAQPLALGTELRGGDRIRTGDGARVHLKLAEGSMVKIGENARLGFHTRSLRPQVSFKGALDIAAGAFRFTTDLIQRTRERDVAVRVGAATIGIRGTDVWGKSGADLDLVMLIEGKVEVRHAGGETFLLAEPLATFVAPKGSAPLPVALATEEELRARARETEIEAGDGAARRGGRWKLALATNVDEVEALDRYDAVRTAGFAARIAPHRAEEGWRYDVVIGGFTDQAEARVAADRLKAATGRDAVVTR